MSEGTTEQTFTVTGMSCDHCENAWRKSPVSKA